MVNISVVIPIFYLESNMEKILESYSEQNINNIEVILLIFELEKTFLERINYYASQYNALKIFNKKNIDNGEARVYLIDIAQKNHITFLDSLKSLTNNNLTELNSKNTIIYSYNSFINKFIENNYFDEYKQTLYNDKIHFIFSEYEKIQDNKKPYFYEDIKKDFTKIINNQRYMDFICNLNDLNKAKFESVIYSNDFDEFNIKFLNAKLHYQNKQLSNELNKLKREIGEILTNIR